MYKAILASIIVMTLSTGVLGWNRRGHLLVSAVAYRQLEKTSPATLGELNVILESHPARGSWQAEFNRAKRYFPDALSKEAYFFIRAAAWPDDVRGNKNEHVETWHYINYPVTLPDRVDFDTLVPTNNIFDGSSKAVSILSDPDARDRDKARMLSWIHHLAGDVHQPLHSVALNNDAGGNAQCVLKPDGRSATLHSYWDGLVGSRKAAAVDVMDAWLDSNFYIGSHANIKPSDYSGSFSLQNWSRESAALSLSDVYRFQSVVTTTFKKVKVSNAKTGKFDRVCPSVREPTLPVGYHQNAEAIALTRILKAGYRLASGLENLGL